ncbi:hypothetical protein EJB05_34968, partial [Eragrostis curvula]
MEANESQQEPRPSHDLNVDHDSLQQPSDAKKKKGGWITFPFLGVAMFGLGIARGGATSNLVVYLVEKYNVPRVDAARISSIAFGCLSLAPVGGAIVADAFFGCYPVVAVSMVFSVLVPSLHSLSPRVHDQRLPRPPAGSVPAAEPSRRRRRPVRGGDGGADDCAVRRRVPAVRERGRRAVLFPLLRRLAGYTPTPLQRIGAGHVLTVVSMAASALIERQRVAPVRAHGEAGDPAWVSPMSAMWLVLPFVVSGAGEALHFPGQVTLYYQEFPPSLKNTGMVAMIIALGFYLSTGPHWRRAARHGVASGQRERLQAGEPLLAAYRACRRQLRILPSMCQIVQVPEHRQVAQDEPSRFLHSSLFACMLFIVL